MAGSSSADKILRCAQDDMVIQADIAEANPASFSMVLGRDTVSVRRVLSP